jgi:hypothetical protein
MRSRTICDQLGDNLLVGRRRRLEHHEPQRQLALELVRDADDGALGHIRMIRQHLLHAAGGEAMAGHVDDVVDAAHDEQIAVVVDEAGIAGQVVPGLVQVGLQEALSFCHSVGRQPGGSGSLIMMRPISPA